MTTLAPNEPCRAVIITALPVEFTAVCEHLDDRREDTHPKGTVYEIGRFCPNLGKEWEVTVAEIGAGNPGAAAEVERAVTYRRPNVIIFVGVAGGLKDVALGDVVAGAKVYGYESGKEKSGFNTRPVVHDSDYRLTQRAKAAARSGDWRRRIFGGVRDPPPRALVGAIAAGEKLVADTKSETSKLIASSYGDTLAVEMEGYGFLHGAYLNEHISALVVRGISDLIDDKENADRSGSQERASRNASAFCFEVLARLDICPGNAHGDDRGPTYVDEVVRIDRALADHEGRFHTIERALGLRAITDAQPHSGHGDRFTSDMDRARDLLNKGLIRAAKVLLDSLLAQKEDVGFTEELHFRLETNLGGATLAQRDYAAAQEHFETALSIRPRDAKALANRAQIALVRGDVPAALRHADEARLMAPLDPHVLSVYFRALDAAGKRDDIAQLTLKNPWILEDFEGAFTLALLASDQGQYDEAERLVRVSLRHQPSDAQSLELLARIIMVPLEISLERNPPLPGKLPEEVVSRASESEALFSEAIRILEGQDYKDLLIVALANRGMVLGLLGRYEEALLDYDRVLANDPSQQIVKLNKGRLLLGMGRPHEALQILEELENVHESAWRPVAIAYLFAKQPQKVLKILQPLWRTTVNKVDRIRVGELLLDAYRDLGQADDAETIASALEHEYSDDAEAAAIAAAWRASQPEQQEHALALFYAAVAKAADERQRDRINLLLADFYYRKQRFAEAADLYRNLASGSDHPTINKRLLLSLFCSGSHREALSLAQKLRGDGPALPLISAVEVNLLEAIGDVEEAKRLLAQLVELEPDNPDHRITLAYLRYRSGDTEGAKEAVLGIAAEEVKGSAHQLMALAKVRAWLNLGDVLELAYRARRLGFDDASIHQAYVSLVLNRKRDEDATLQISKAQPGSTVHLLSEDGQSKILTIVEGLDADLHLGELLPSDPVALKLLGLGAGDSVNLKQSAFETVSFQINKVESQYVFAFQETLLNFSTWFPDLQGLEKMKADQTGIDKIFQMVNQRQAHAEMILGLYRGKQISLGMLAQLGGHSVFDTWASLQSEDEYRVIASMGDSQDTQFEATSLATADKILLELTGLLTMAALELLPALKKRFPQIVAPQFLLDEVNDELTLERAGLRSLRTATTLYREGDRYVMQEGPSIHTKWRAHFLQTLVDFLTREVTLLPAREILDFPEHGRGPLGRAALASVLLAKEHAALLYSDDLVLRVVAKNSWGATGVWSQAVIRELARTNNISEDDYHRGVIRLVQRNYQFVSVSWQDYLWSLRQDDMRVTPGFSRALRALEGPECTEDSAISAAGSLIREVWLEPGPRTTRYLVLDACVSALKHGRHPLVVLSKLEALMPRLLGVRPDALSEVMKSIFLWKHETELMDERFGTKRGTPFGWQR